MPDSLEATQAVADVVDPSSGRSNDLLNKMSGKSYFDSMNKATLGSARAVPGMDDSSDFAKGLDQALQADPKNGEAANDAVETQNTPASEAQPSEPRKLTDPPIRKATAQKHHFKELKQELAQTKEQWQQREQELLKQLEEFQSGKVKTDPASDPVVSEILKERDQLRQELAAYGVVKNPELDARQSAVIRQAKSLTGDKGSLVETVLSMPPGAHRDAKLEEIISELPSSTASVVKAANQKLAEIEFSRGVEVEAAKATLAERQRAAEQQALAQKASRSRDFDSLVSEWRTSVEALDPSKDKQAATRVAQARNWFENTGSLSAKEQAAIAVQAALVPVLIEESNSQSAEIARLRHALSRYEGSLPSGEAAVEIDNDTPAPRNFEERSNQFQRGLDAALRQDPMLSAHRRAKLY